jgi:Mce-associated membrane protein
MTMTETTPADVAADTPAQQNDAAATTTRSDLDARSRVRAVVRPVARALTRFRILPWLLAGALVLAAAGVGVLGYNLHQENLQQQRDQDILAAARQEALNFVSIDYRNFDQDSKNVLAGATGDFKQQFSDQAQTLKSLVTTNKAVSSGQVLQAGVVTANATNARVLVVADGTVANTAAPSGQVRNYRLQMDLVDEGGTWLTSDIEFVG